MGRVLAGFFFGAGLCAALLVFRYDFSDKGNFTQETGYPAWPLFLLYVLITVLPVSAIGGILGAVIAVIAWRLRRREDEDAGAAARKRGKP